LTPGTYGARLLVKPVEAAPASSTNELAFSVIPQTTGITGTNPGPYTLSILGSYLLDSGVDVELSVAGVVFTRTSGTLGAAQFQLPNTGPGAGSTVLFTLPSTLVPATSTPLAVRLVVNGAIATPEWIVS
jgi:hypothetical protein